MAIKMICVCYFVLFLSFFSPVDCIPPNSTLLHLPRASFVCSVTHLSTKPPSVPARHGMTILMTIMVILMILMMLMMKTTTMMSLDLSLSLSGSLSLYGDDMSNIFGGSWEGVSCFFLSNGELGLVYLGNPKKMTV